ncbi:MAG: hypothetical protein ACD_3C00213G0007 [uncultured bacterium (gcode 4)]|uniref:Uncharacterized protein n=1 Tax=uncultured bacterium (gcode 4) TaxID=1234023 RepID=K2FWN5_9BACT|nr:MAG: hypothetical protein ACD_3C00213G0007 [uncultured bacterium (gcode 4)]
MKKKIYILSTMIFSCILISILFMLILLLLMRFEILDKSFLYSVFVMNNWILYLSCLIWVGWGFKLWNFWWEYIYASKKDRKFNK